jgi:hypothetical protein
MSEITGPGFKYPAFSGKLGFTNVPVHMYTPRLGPLPIGEYAIVDRNCGNLKTCATDYAALLVPGVNSRLSWFALYALDGKIDDETFLRGVRRGEFRLHPGINSEGCVTLPNDADFKALRNRLLPHKGTHRIGGTQIVCYGVLDVTF